MQLSWEKLENNSVHLIKVYNLGNYSLKANEIL